MAISANAVWEVRSTATAGNLNGGFFVTGASGTDYSQQNAAQYSTSTATTAGIGAVISWAAAASDMVGNGLNIASGTNFTAGWYEIISVSVGVSVTVDRNCCTGVGSNGVIKVGGAMSLGSSDDAVFESMVAGNVMHVKGNATYTLGGTVTISAAGGAQQPIKVMGYATTRGDSPKGSTRPTFNTGAAGFSPGQQWQFWNLIFTGAVSATSSVIASATNNSFFYCKVINTTTTAAKNAILLGTDNFHWACEYISPRGNGVSITGNNTTTLIGCVIRDCDTGFITSSAGPTPHLINCIIHSCVTYGIRLSVGVTTTFTIDKCTIYGRNNVGVGVSLATGTTDVRITNSIIKGWATGVSHADTQTIGIDEYNSYQGNTTDVTNWTKGGTDVALNPTFSSVGLVTVSTGTTSNTGNTLTKSGATFQTSGVTAGRDYVYISAGAGVTVGTYGISSVDSETQLTLDSAPGNSTGDVTAAITTGHNFMITNSSLYAAGFPGSFPGGYTTSYLAAGAVSPQVTVASSGSLLLPDLKL